MKTLTVVFLPEDRRPGLGPDKECEYRVTQVENSVDFNPRQYMTRSQVEQLCNLPGAWRVVVKEFK